jgi:hypothetical protein
MNGASAQKQIDELKKEAKVNKSALNGVVSCCLELMAILQNSCTQYTLSEAEAEHEHDLFDNVDMDRHGQDERD